MRHARWISVVFLLAGLASSAAEARIEVVSWSYPTPCRIDRFELRHGPSPDNLGTVIDVGRPRQAGSQFSYELDVLDGEELYVCVAAVKAGETSECSAPIAIEATSDDDQWSEPAPSEAQRSWCEDFSGSSPLSGWLATGPDNSLLPMTNLFAVASIGDANRALQTSSEEDDIHTHFLGPNDHGAPASQWSRYEYSGQMMFSEPGSGIGVTIYSRYNLMSNYYRLGRDPLSGSFRLERDQVDPSYKCVAEGPETFVQANRWYAFRVHVRDDGVLTTLRSKVWHADRREPEGFQWTCTDARSDGQLSGAVGVWATGSGTKSWDSLHVAELMEPSDADPLGIPGKPALVR